MKKRKYQLFRYLDGPDKYHLVMEIHSKRYVDIYKDKVKLIKEFDDIDEAIEFRKALNLL